MKLKGRRQSTNVEDRRNEKTEIPDGAQLTDGSIYYNPKTSSAGTRDPKIIDVARELGRHNREKTTPVPTPRPNISNIQVTPGKWKTR